MRAALLIAAALFVPLAAAAPVATQRLFDGRTLAGWSVTGAPAWRVEGGSATADTGAMSFLVSDRSYRDFELTAEFWVSEDANSGIFIRCANRAAIDATSCYEINIFDTRPDPTYGTGSIVALASVSQMPKAGGRWNLMRITARGDRFDVVLNGQTTVRGARDPRLAAGPIALQRGAGTVRFRKLVIRPL